MIMVAGVDMCRTHYEEHSCQNKQEQEQVPQTHVGKSLYAMRET